MDAKERLEQLHVPPAAVRLNPVEIMALISDIINTANLLHVLLVKLEAAQAVSALPLPRPLMYAARQLDLAKYHLRQEMELVIGRKNDSGDSADGNGIAFREVVQAARSIGR